MTDVQQEIADMMVKDIRYIANQVHDYHNEKNIKNLDLLIRSYETFMSEVRKQEVL